LLCFKKIEGILLFWRIMKIGRIIFILEKEGFIRVNRIKEKLIEFSGGE